MLGAAPREASGGHRAEEQPQRKTLKREHWAGRSKGSGGVGWTGGGTAKNMNLEPQDVQSSKEGTVRPIEWLKGAQEAEDWRETKMSTASYTFSVKKKSEVKQ